MEQYCQVPNSEDYVLHDVVISATCHCDISEQCEFSLPIEVQAMVPKIID